MACCCSVGASSTASADFQACVWTSRATSDSMFTGEHLSEERTVDVAARKDGGHLAAGDARALLLHGGDTGCARAFGDVVRGLEDERDRLGDLVVAHLDDAIDVAPHHLECRRIRLAHRH